MSATLPENFSPNHSIHAEIDLLRQKCKDTQELYQEVCTLLFFRYGSTPTANKLYQLVRKGSMSAPAEALARFWEILREKSRVRIEHPDLPEALREVAGQTIAVLWQQAQKLAEENLTALRKEAQEGIRAAQAAAEEASHQEMEAQKSLQTIQERLQSCEEQLRIAEQKLARTEGQKATLEEQLADTLQQRQRLETALQTSQQDFSTQLEHQRAAAAAMEARYRSDLQRAFQEVEHERSNALLVGRELKAAKESAAKQQAEFQKILRTNQQEFFEQSERQRAFMVSMENQYTASLQQALKDVEKERANLSEIQEVLEKVRQGAKEQAEQDHSTINLLQTERAQLYQKLGELEGSLAEMRIAQDLLIRQLQSPKRKKI
jgi:DNA repair exonuclease SbcCD ATPase subunit